MDKIDLTTIRGRWQEYRYDPDSDTTIGGGGDDTAESLQTIASKVNEIVEYINRKEAQNG